MVASGNFLGEHGAYSSHAVHAILVGDSLAHVFSPVLASCCEVLVPKHAWIPRLTSGADPVLAKSLCLPLQTPSNYRVRFTMIHIFAGKLLDVHTDISVFVDGMHIMHLSHVTLDVWCQAVLFCFL